MTSKTTGSRLSPMRLIYTAIVSAIAFALAGLQAVPASAGSRKGITIGVGAGVAAAIALGSIAIKKPKSTTAGKSGSSGKKSATKGRNSNSQSRSLSAKKEGGGKSSATEKKSRQSQTASRNSQERSSGKASRQAGTSKKPDSSNDNISTSATGDPGDSMPAEGTSDIAVPARAPATRDEPRAPTTAARLIATPSEISAAQEHLRYLGYDVTTISGVIDAPTRSAVMKYQQSLGAAVTGDLTVEQLQSLFRSAAQKESSGT